MSLIELVVRLRISARYAYLTMETIFLHKSLLHSRHLLEQTHYLGVCDLHVGIHVGGCAVQDNERNRLSWVD